MALIVQKYGGTSVGNRELIERVAHRILETHNAGNQVVAVISAMSGETNRLDKLAREINPDPFSLDYDMLMASGEQASIGLVSLAINKAAADQKVEFKDRLSRPLLGHQIGILTDHVFSGARIEAIDTSLMKKELEKGLILVIAGFQGVDSDGNITTLGRGGSDTSAVAIAAALGADTCEIYTDVDGVYTTDPRLCSDARKLSEISYEEMMEMSSMGAKVLQIRSVELAANYGLEVHVRSSFPNEEGIFPEGTKVMSQELLSPKMEKVTVSGVAADQDQAKFTLQGVPDQPGVAAEIFGALSEKEIVVDIIVQDVSRKSGLLNMSFTVPGGDFDKSKAVLEELQRSKFQEMIILEDKNLAKVTIVGVGMQHHPGVASKMFQLLAEVDINIHLITTSEIKVSCLIQGKDGKKAVEQLHKGFELDKIS